MNESAPAGNHKPANPFEILKRGAAAWNAWHQGGRNGPVDLSGADLSGMDLSGVDLSGINLKGADFFRSNLSRANLKMTKLDGADLSNANLSDADAYKADFSGAFLSEADLTHADLSDANLAKADLRSAKLAGANLRQARLTGARLSEANLREAVLADADIADADLRLADLSGANLTGMRFGNYRTMVGHYYGIRGLEATYGNALFVRDAKDQDYLDTLLVDIERAPEGGRKGTARFLFRLWGLIDHGRSLAKVTLYAFIIAAIYGTIYALDLAFDWGLLDYTRSARSWFTPYYCSIVTYTTLGFGDVTAASVVGEILIVSEVVLGYLTLGLLLSILANTIARRS